MNNTPLKIPVTVLTGFLGAGKTTLLNRLLTSGHGKRYAVIVNEFGEIGIDNDLIVASDEEIFEMSNGCICCTVRGDLIRVINGLLRRSHAFDGILVETTGLADPAPVAQTFLTDRDIASRTSLDSVITVVDAMHLKAQVKTSPEVEQQIAFADTILLNKVDLVDEAELADCEAIIHTINPFATFHKAARGDIPLDKLLGVGGFDLDKIMARAPDFLKAEEEHAPHAHEHHHEHGEECDCCCGCNMSGGHAKAASAFRHDTAISSVSLVHDKPFDEEKVQNWLGELTATKGPDLLRFKGILDLAGVDKRIVIQGVHMMMEGGALSPWPEGARRVSRMVFIGRNLDEPRLRADFMACVKIG